ncbi:hypothetical protein EMPS_06371 [Entomortierella parvispora]|uniref:Uncharacterized protein n=1 Tax=Entomortierella parvispora TaxID=205924 RepID=A0A9P3HCU6_9FUNG|nr:hypothetical protein EMPS_06371 [Entomortierella parvispora]
MSGHTRHFARMVVLHHLRSTTTYQQQTLPAAFLSSRKYMSTKKPDLTEPEITVKDSSRFKAPLSTPELVVPPSLESLFPPDHTHTHTSAGKETASESSGSSDYSPSSSPPPPHSSSASSYSSPGDEEGTSGTGSSDPQAPPKPKSRFWFYLYQVLFWSAIGSLPVHLLLTKGETKDTKIKQEWRIAVLEDMRDKLKRGESIEEEEAMLTIGLDRSKREVEQVDEKYFEELLHTAEKMDFVFTGDKVKDSKIAPAVAATPAEPVPEPAVPRKPAPPKTEKSYL